MNPLSYSSYRFLRDIIQRAVWMYPRFALSFRDVEELLAERGITVTYETIRRWVLTFDPVTEATHEGLEAVLQGQPPPANSFIPASLHQRLSHRLSHYRYR
jgi:hypothetical protein